MNQNQEQVIIQTTETVTKISGSATAATGTIGFWQLVLEHQQPIMLIIAGIGLAITVLSYRLNRKHLNLRTAREEAKHIEEMAVLAYQKEQLSQQRRESDKTT